MRWSDPFLFLVGNRNAIGRIATDRWAWLTGAVLVFGAGVARNYDHLELLREPEWFVGPFAASLVSILFIFACLAGPLKLRKAGPLPAQLGTFLTLAWLTAPCAWLYGLPVESATDIVTATRWNIAFLAIVSVWRVALMTRAVSVLAGVRWQRTLPLVLGPAALEAMLGAAHKSLSLVQIMGGIRLPPETQLLQNAASFAARSSFWILLVCILLIATTKGVATKSLARPRGPSSPVPLVLAGVALGLWLLAALPEQDKLIHRRQLQTLIQDERYTDAIAYAARLDRAAFPSIRPLPPEGRFPLGLLDALPPNAPEWLRHDWTAAAVESMKADWGLEPAEIAQLEQHEPRIRDILHAHAEAIRSDPSRSVDDFESWWLRNYDEMQTSPP